MTLVSKKTLHYVVLHIPGIFLKMGTSGASVTIHALTLCQRSVALEKAVLASKLILYAEQQHTTGKILLPINFTFKLGLRF